MPILIKENRSISIDAMITNKDIKRMFGNWATDSLQERSVIQDPHERGRPPNEKDAAILINLLKSELAIAIRNDDLCQKLEALGVKPIVDDAFTNEGGFEIGHNLSSAFDITFLGGFTSGNYESFGYPMINHVLRCWPEHEQAIQEVADGLTAKANGVIERFAQEYGYVAVDTGYGYKMILPEYKAVGARISQAMGALFGERRA